MANSEGRVAWPTYAGANYIAEELKRAGKEPASELGLIVAKILGEVWAGIYHIDGATLFHKRTNWSDASFITITIRGDLATHDFSDLTWLVLLGHAHGVRVGVQAAAREYLRLTFMLGDNVRYCGRVPTIAEIVERFTERFPSLPVSRVLPNNGGTNQ